MLANNAKAWIMASLFVGLTVGAVGSQAVARQNGAHHAVNESLGAGIVSPGPASFSGLVKAVQPAVVNISISGHVPVSRSPFRGFQGPELRGSPFDDFFRRYFGEPDYDQGGSGPEFRAVGSGFVISSDGLVVTNNHVVEHAEDIDVVMIDGTRYSATVQGRDPKTDLALLKVDADKPLPFVELGSSEDAQVGDWVVAVGNPFGLGGTVTAGIISARGRDIQAGPFDDFLQVDAPINQGNSGGPLFDAQGRVIGINTAIYSPSGGSVGIGFAIPSELAGDIIEQLKANGVVERGFLGVEFQPVTEAVAASLGLDRAQGALVAKVLADGPADRAGMKVGDVIMSLGGKKLDDPKDLPRLVAATPAGEEVELEVLRNGHTRKIDVEIGRSEPETLLAGSPGSQSDRAQLGVRLSALTPDLQRRLDVDRGVVVTDVQRGSPAAKAGIRPGEVITMVGQVPVDSPADVVSEVEKAVDEGRPSVLLMVEQRGARRFVAVEIAA